MIIIVSGVSGVGKTTVGRLLAEERGWDFFDADDFHSAANVAKMSAGKPLDDEDRRAWLASLSGLIADHLTLNRSAVLACSALRVAYREQLCISGDVKLVLLQADFSIISGRMHLRSDHFMKPELLKSQFDTLEPANEGDIVIDASQTPEAIVKQIMNLIR